MSKEVQKGWPLLYDRAQRENRWSDSFIQKKTGDKYVMGELEK